MAWWDEGKRSADMQALMVFIHHGPSTTRRPARSTREGTRGALRCTVTCEPDRNKNDPTQRVSRCRRRDWNPDTRIMIGEKGGDLA